MHYTTDLLFKELWLRPGLAPRDRSLVTVSALIANGQTAQIPYHLNRAMDNVLTRAEASEILTQLAFYVGWPNKPNGGFHDETRRQGRRGHGRQQWNWPRDRGAIHRGGRSRLITGRRKEELDRAVRALSFVPRA